MRSSTSAHVGSTSARAAAANRAVPASVAVRNPACTRFRAAPICPRTIGIRSSICGRRPVEWRPFMSDESTGLTVPAPPALVDIGVNLAHDSFDRDRDDVMTRAVQAGVVQMIVTGSSVASSRKALELARAHPGRLFATVGIHPHHATELTDETLAALEALRGP